MRCGHDRELEPATVGELTATLEAVNPFIPIYRHAHDQMAALGADRASLTADLRLVMEPGADRRRENLPTVSDRAGRRARSIHPIHPGPTPVAPRLPG